MVEFFMCGLWSLECAVWRVCVCAKIVEFGVKSRVYRVCGVRRHRQLCLPRKMAFHGRGNYITFLSKVLRLPRKIKQKYCPCQIKRLSTRCGTRANVMKCHACHVKRHYNLCWNLQKKNAAFRIGPNQIKFGRDITLVFCHDKQIIHIDEQSTRTTFHRPKNKHGSSEQLSVLHHVRPFARSQRDNWRTQGLQFETHNEFSPNAFPVQRWDTPDTEWKANNHIPFAKWYCHEWASDAPKVLSQFPDSPKTKTKQGVGEDISGRSWTLSCYYYVFRYFSGMLRNWVFGLSLFILPFLSAV